QLRELVRIRHRLKEKQTLCKVQLVRNIDTIWPDYNSVMKRVLGKTSLAILKKYSVPSKVRAISFEQFYELVHKTSRSKVSFSKPSGTQARSRTPQKQDMPPLEGLTGACMPSVR
ncbi:MAG: hypothetical protein Q8N79_02435, partial [Candidatus Methanoperedens sp.]|nr:hypothetical protein [Candidatus Methanoperedens sp.]